MDPEESKRWKHVGPTSVVPTKIGFTEDIFSIDCGRGDGLGMIQTHYTN